MKSKIIAFLAALMLAKSAMAGGSSVGNGGNTIVCFDGNNQIKSVELLDFYEARVKRGVSPDMGDDSLSADEKIAFVFDRLKQMSPWFVASLKGELDEFKKDSVFLPGIRLVNVDDSDHLFIPSGCQREQTAIQKAPEFPGDKRYSIDQDLWTHMDATNRAGLILHEIFYHYAIQYGKPENSAPVRFLVSSIASSVSISESEYVDVLRTLKFSQVFIHNHNFVVNDAQPYYENGIFYGGDLYGDAAFTLQNKPVWVTSIRYNKTGNVAGVGLSKPTYLKVPGQSLWFAAHSYIGLNADEIAVAGTPLPQNAEFKADGLYDFHLSESTTEPIYISFFASPNDDQIDRCTNCQGRITIAGQSFDVDNFERNFSFQNVSGMTAHLSHPTSFKFLGRELLIQGIFSATNEGQIAVATLATPTLLTVGKNEVLFGPGPIEFYGDNQLMSGLLGEDTLLMDAITNGTQTPYLKGMQLHFDEQGRVVDAVVPENPSGQ